MKIGVLSDTHMPEKAKVLPQKLITEFKNCDMVIHVGDMVSMDVVQVLKKVCPNFKAVCGNMDSAEIKNNFPEKEIIQIEKFRIGISHGCGPTGKILNLMKEVFKNDRVDMVIFGHSHDPTNKKDGGIIFFNPGSPTDDIFAPYKSFGIVEINDKIEAKIVKL